MKTSFKFLALIVFCASFTLSSIAQTSCNPLTLNGKPLDITNFTVLSKGTLVWGKATPSAASADNKIPFMIYLKRGNKIISEGASSPTNVVYEIEVGQILTLAQYGDELIIEPARKQDAQQKQVIGLHKYLFNYNFITRRDGC